MLTIDEIKIEGEEDGFHLVIYAEQDSYYAETKRYRIGLPDQFHAETVRTIGRWLAEGEQARVEYVTMRDDRGGEGYAPDDPKSEGFHDRMSSVWDDREGK